MGKKIILIIVILILGVVLGGGIYYFIKKNQNSASNKVKGTPNSNLQLKSEETIGDDLTYTSDAGFSFKYPKGIKVTDVTPSGDEYYTVLSLKGSGGEATITAKDTLYKTLDDYLKSLNPKPVLSGAVTLGGISAKQYSQSAKLFTFAIDKGVLFQIESPKDNGYWEKVQDTVVTSFVFKGQNESSAASQDSNAIYEEEEIVE